MSPNPYKQWPSYGYLPYKGEYFRLHHGKSNKQLADIPFSAIENLISRLKTIDMEAKNVQDFAIRSSQEINHFNKALPIELLRLKVPEGMIRASIDRYYWGDPKSIRGLKLSIDQEKFKWFIEHVSLRKNNDLWRTFEYIYISKNFFAQSALVDPKFKSKISRYTNSVKQYSTSQLNSIDKGIQDIREKIEQSIEKFKRVIHEENGKQLLFFPYCLQYLNQMRLKISSIKALSELGDFSSCFTEMRGVMEGLGFQVFLDVLQARAVQANINASNMDLLRQFSQSQVSEARKDREFRGIQPRIISLQTNREIGNSFLESVSRTCQLDYEKKGILVSKVYEKMSMASFVMLHGKPRKNVKGMKDWDDERMEKSPFPFIDFGKGANADFLNIGVKELTDTIKDTGVNISKNEVEKLFMNYISGSEVVVLPPQTKFSFDFLYHSFAKEDLWYEMKSLYDAFSPFAHSCWESTTIWPFISVLEIQTFNNVLKEFSSLVSKALVSYFSFFDSTRDGFFGS